MDKEKMRCVLGGCIGLKKKLMVILQQRFFYFLVHYHYFLMRMRMVIFPLVYSLFLFSI